VDEPLKSLPEYTRREIAFLAQSEKAIHLDDILLRRTMLAMLGRLTKTNVEEIADAMGAAIGWSVEQKNAEVERTLRLLADRHGVRL
jgi:glycerol-3-phosphate dehydrogenase